MTSPSASPPQPLVTPVANRNTGYYAALQAMLDGMNAQMGFLPDSVGIYLHRPEIAEATLRLTAAIGKDPSSTLDRKLKRKIGFLCSAFNGCRYCTSHQCSYLMRSSQDGSESWGLDRAELEQLLDGSAPVADELESACLDFARAATLDSSSIPNAVSQRVRLHLTPAQIVELVFVVGHWKLYNTVNDSLGLMIESVNSAHTGYVEHARAVGAAGQKKA